MLTGNCSNAPECLNIVLSMMFTLWILHQCVFPRWFIISQASRLCCSIMGGPEPSYDFITFQHEYWRFHSVWRKQGERIYTQVLSFYSQSRCSHLLLMLLFSMVLLECSIISPLLLSLNFLLLLLSNFLLTSLVLKYLIMLVMAKLFWDRNFRVFFTAAAWLIIFQRDRQRACFKMWLLFQSCPEIKGQGTALRAAAHDPATG